MRKPQLWIAVPLALLLCLAVTARILTCPRCGYEYTPGQAVCAHCEAELPEAKKSVEPPEEPKIPVPLPEEPQVRTVLESTASVDTVAAAAVDEELAHARRALEEAEFALAYLHAWNALGLRQLLPHDASPAEDDIDHVIESLVNSLGRKSGKCFVCDGTGVQKQPILTMDRETRVQTLDNTKCPACDGRRFLAGHSTATELNRERVRAGRAFRAYHKDRNSERLGNVMIPRELDGQLDIHQRVAVLTIAAGHCPTCLGDGNVACGDCNGIGRTACTGDGCVMGLQPCPQCDGTGWEKKRRGNSEVLTFCSGCRRRGIVTCDTCEGRASLVCPNCQSDGEEPCTTCKGTGEPKFCSRCDGEGLAECRRCRGSGEYRGEACTECDEEGELTCKSCEGTGRSKRR